MSFEQMILLLMPQSSPKERRPNNLCLQISTRDEMYKGHCVCSCLFALGSSTPYLSIFCWLMKALKLKKKHFPFYFCKILFFSHSINEEMLSVIREAYCASCSVKIK